MNRVKTYWLVTPIGYKITVLLVLPLLLIFGRIATAIIAFDVLTAVYVVFSGVFFMLFEIMGDFFTFGGSYAKGKERFDFFKSSDKGVYLLKGIYVTDIIRKFIYCFGILGLMQMTNLGLSPFAWGSVGLLAYGLLALGSIATRFISIWNYAIIPAYIGAFLYTMAFAFICSDVWFASILLFAVGLATSIIASVVLVWLAMYKIKESYHD